jgi:hypothetical protein
MKTKQMPLRIYYFHEFNALYKAIIVHNKYNMAQIETTKDMNDSNCCIGVVIIKVFNHFKKFDSK